MNILHQVDSFLVAELPSAEAGVKTLLTKAGDTVMIHRLEQGVATVSQSFNLPALRAIVSALDSLPAL